MEEQEVKPKRGRKKVELKKEEKFIVIGTLNEKLEEKVKKLAEKDGVVAISFSKDDTERLLENLIPGFDEASTEESKRLLTQFLISKENQKGALDKAVFLFTACTGGNLSTLDADKAVFEIKDITRHTNLSHSDAKQVLSLLYAFGYIVYVKGSHRFRFVFSPKQMNEMFLEVVKDKVSLLNSEISRYTAFIERSEGLNKEEKAKLLKNLNEYIDATIEF